MNHEPACYLRLVSDTHDIPGAWYIRDVVKRCIFIRTVAASRKVPPLGAFLYYAYHHCYQYSVTVLLAPLCSRVRTVLNYHSSQTLQSLSATAATATSEYC